MGAKLGSNSGPMADINVTPLIDVVLVLLVVFMVITPMLQSGMAVDLPQATQTDTVNDAGQHIVISITKDRGVWVEDVEVDLSVDGTELIEAINEKYRENPARSLLLKADRELEYQQVRKIMDVLSENKMTSVLIAASKEK